jgi:uncharacterized membrane protein
VPLPTLRQWWGYTTVERMCGDSIRSTTGRRRVQSDRAGASRQACAAKKQAKKRASVRSNRRKQSKSMNTNTGTGASSCHIPCIICHIPSLLPAQSLRLAPRFFVPHCVGIVVGTTPLSPLLQACSPLACLLSPRWPTRVTTQQQYAFDTSC